MTWGLAGVALFVLTWMPWLVYELTHNLAETRAILAFNQDDPPAADPLTRSFFSAVRILAWPMTHWPLDGLASGFPVALAVATGIAAGLIWRVTGALTGTGAGSVPAAAGKGKSGDPAVAVAGVTGSARPAPRGVARSEREGLLFVGGSLLLIAALLGLGIKEVSQFANINQEQYHAVADVFVILAAGLVVGGLWRAAPLRGRPWSGHAVASLALAGLVAVGVGNWPPLTAPDGGWPAAQTATARLERDAAGQEIALVALPSFIPSDGYGYPLRLDGVKITAPGAADTVVVLCFTEWWKKCGDTAETDWVAANLTGQSFELLDRFEPAPQRILSVYRRTP